MSNLLKYTIIGISALILLVIGVIVYRMFFQFKSAAIRQYVNEEANKYMDKAGAAQIITDGVEYILSSHNLTSQVLKAAKTNKTDVEQELVHAAVNQCKAFKYLPA